MATNKEEKSRVDELIQKLEANKALIDGAEKGEITINFNGSSVTVAVKTYL